MSDSVKVVSRSQLFNDFESSTSGSESDSDNSSIQSSNESIERHSYQIPSGFDFEIVDVEDPGVSSKDDADSNSNHDRNMERSVEVEEERIEYFPMFSTDPRNNTTDGTNSGLIKVKLVKELTEEEEKILIQEQIDKILKEQKRPDNYYFVEYSKEEILQFQNVALTGEQVIQLSKIRSKPNNYKLIDLNKHNLKISQLLKQEQKKKLLIKRQHRQRNASKPIKKSNRRMGKNQRLLKVEERKRKLIWNKEIEVINERVVKWLAMNEKKPKKKTRRGGKKHKRPVNNSSSLVSATTTTGAVAIADSKSADTMVPTIKT